MTKQQEFIKFYNGLSLQRKIQVEQACIDSSDLAFCKESWSRFLWNVWSVPESFFPIIWKIVDETYSQSK